MSALAALNQTLTVLAEVSRALDAAQASHQGAADAQEVKAVAARAMQVRGCCGMQVGPGIQGRCRRRTTARG